MFIITVKDDNEINHLDYRMSLLDIYIRLHVSAAMRPSLGLYRASRVKYNGLGTQWNPNMFRILLKSNIIKII